MKMHPFGDCTGAEKRKIFGFFPFPFLFDCSRKSECLHIKGYVPSVSGTELFRRENVTIIGKLILLIDSTPCDFLFTSSDILSCFSAFSALPLVNWCRIFRPPISPPLLLPDLPETILSLLTSSLGRDIPTFRRFSAFLQVKFCREQPLPARNPRSPEAPGKGGSNKNGLTRKLFWIWAKSVVSSFKLKHTQTLHLSNLLTLKGD